MTFLCLTLLLLTSVVSIFSDESNKASKNYEPEYLDSLLKEKKYEEFARILDVDVEHVKPSQGNRQRSMFKKSLRGGDLMLTKVQSEQGRQGLHFDREPDRKWPGSPALIPFTISNEYSHDVQQTIYNGIAEWNILNPCVQWVDRTTEEDYVNFFSGNGCWSNLGKTGGAQGLSIEAPGCDGRSIILHEMNHAAGFTHEHERPDRDEYIRILWDNIPDDWKPSYQKGSEEEFGIQGKYDYYSLMHYNYEAPDTDGLPAYEILQDGIDSDRIGKAETLTEIDREKLAKQYC